MSQNKVITYLLQAFFTFMVLLPLYMILVLLDYNGGFPSFLGFIIQPVIGALLTFITIMVCSVIGLPIRFAKTINSWWVKRPYIPVTGAIAAVALIALSFLPNLRNTLSYMEGEYTINKEVPNETMVLIGWFLLAFCILHFYPVTYIKIKRPPNR